MSGTIMTKGNSAVPIVEGTFFNSAQKLVRFGPGSLTSIGKIIEGLDCKRPFLVSSRSVLARTNAKEVIENSLESALVGVFDATIAHVPQAAVLAGAEVVRESGADSLISIGGGSVSDLTKMIALAIGNDIRDVSGFESCRVHYESGKEPQIPVIRNTLMPTVAVPTTLSAAEFSGFAGVTDEVRQCKDLYVDDKLTPYAVILDARLLEATPDWLLLSSGIRALDHCVEVILSSTAQVFTDALARDALQRLVCYLPRLKGQRRDVTDVTQCQLASWESLFALSNVLLGLSHGLGHQLGARCRVPHGYTSCVMLPYVMAFNLPVTQEQQAKVAKLMGVPTDLLTSAEAAAVAGHAVQAFVRSLGLPTTLKEVGVEEKDLFGIATDAMKDLIVATNPRPVTSVEQVVELLRTALGE